LSSGPGRGPLKAKTRVRIPMGAPKRTHPEPRMMVVEQFLAMLRFEQRDSLAEKDRKFGCFAGGRPPNNQIFGYSQVICVSPGSS
jgi:hypothetical protein